MVTSFASKPRVDNPSVGKNFKPAPSRTSPSSGSSSDQSSSSRSNGSSASSSSSGSSQQSVSSKPASTPGIIQALGVGSGPLSQTPNFGTGPSSPAGQNFARQAAQSGSANFSSRSGQPQQVSSSSNTSQPSTPRPSTIQDAGVTRALASGGAFGSGKNTFAQASFSPIQTRNNINQTPLPSNDGSSRSLFARGSSRSADRLARFESQVSKQEQRQTQFFNSQGFQRIRDTSSLITFGQGVPVEQRSWIGRRAENFAYGSMAGPIYLGGAVGMTAEKSYLTSRALFMPETRANVFPTYGQAIRPALQVYRDPDTYVAAAVGGASLGYSMTRGYYSPRSVRVSSSRGVVGESSVAGDSISGFATSRSVGSAQYQYGPFGMFRRTQKVPVESQIIYQGQRVPGTNQFGVRVESVTSVPTRAGLRFASNDFGGVYNANTNVLSLRSPTGQFFFSQGGRTTPAFFDTVSTVESAPGRYVSLETGRGGFARVTGSGRTGQLLEQQEMVRVPVTANRYFSAIGPETRFTRIESQSLARGQTTGGANPDLFTGGFQNLERTGLYRDPRVTQRAPITDRVAQEAGAFFENRRGNIRMSRGSQENIFEPSRVPGETISRNPGSFELTGLPTGQFPAYAGSRFPAFIPNTAARYSTATSQPQTQRGTQRIINRPLTDTTPLPAQDTLPRQSIIPTQTTFTPFRTSGNPRTPPPSSLTPPAPPPPNAPPYYPVVPFIPLVPSFGRGGPSFGQRSFSASSFKYVPSLTAGYLGIRGRKPKSLLNPIEIRPILSMGRRR